MKTLAVLVVLAAIVAVFLLGGNGALWAQSPLPARSPIHPPGLEDCPLACIEDVIGVGHPTCNVWCVGTYDLGIAAEYVNQPKSGECCSSEPEFRDEADCRSYWRAYYFDPDESDAWTQYMVAQCIAQLPCPRSGWNRMADWMGAYELWTDGAAYCVVGK